MSHGVCECGWEGDLRSVRFQMPNLYAAEPMQSETMPMCLTCRHDFRRELREHGASEMRVTEVTSTT